MPTPIGGGRLWRPKFAERSEKLQGDGQAGVSAAGKEAPDWPGPFKYRIKFQRGALRCWRRIMLNLWHAYIRAAQVGWDANVVVAMRLMRLAAGGALAMEARMLAKESSVKRYGVRLSGRGAPAA